ncbi:hypothetical protein [Actinomycetospora sp. NBRC 106378]|uniref:hypothetical protein n=1 Tax=Actinomycetospora sp. NBRC 106378 TaxID=3032208 RepID=UPI0024A2D475|nr:hypothetical protein [Actinomycetospora sp. NBRC 106378]GLZ50885.1 hypothetical protein Acsp07_05020 [Actinomycetospora sp. NBRC 106378]
MRAATHRCGGWSSRDEARRREVTTVQLLPHHLREGRLPAAAVGDVVHVTPVLHASAVDRLGGRPERLWDLDRYGTLVACGVPGPRTVPAGDLDVLVVGDRAVLLDCAGLDPRPDLEAGRPVYVEGSVHLDVDVRDHAATDRAYRLRAVRRYRLRPGGAPPRTQHLDRIPDAHGIDDDVFLHVADLVGVDVDLDAAEAQP